MNTYYFAHQIYQFSYAKPLYEKIGGVFVMKKIKKYLPFKYHLRNNNFSETGKSLFNAPELMITKPSKLNKNDGVYFSLSNIRLNVNKNSKTVFIGHGTGDKKYGGKPVALENYDYIFLSGEKYREKLIDVGLNIPDERLVKIGNLRFDDYVNNRFDKNILLKNLGVKDLERKNILYAPTWKWGNGTLMKYFFSFAKEITQKYNLIVRPHHFDSKKIGYLKTWAKLNGISNIYFSNPANLNHSDTFHDFKISDLLISDTSSILYEYLITKKPIIIAIHTLPDLHNMPDSMNVMKIADIYDGSQNIMNMIKDNLEDNEKSKQFETLLHSCFYFNDGKSVSRAEKFVKNFS